MKRPSTDDPRLLTDGGLTAENVLDACDLCEQNLGVTEKDVRSEETGEMATAWLCSDCLDRLGRYNHGDDAFDEITNDEETATDGGERLVTDGGLAFRDLHAFGRDILFAVHRLEDDDLLKGLAVKRSLEDDYSDEVHHSQLYQNLDQLFESGLLEKGTKNGRTNEYGTTATARRMLERHTRRCEAALGHTPPNNTS